MLSAVRGQPIWVRLRQEPAVALCPLSQSEWLSLLQWEALARPAGGGAACRLQHRCQYRSIWPAVQGQPKWVRAGQESAAALCLLSPSRWLSLMPWEAPARLAGRGATCRPRPCRQRRLKRLAVRGRPIRFRSKPGPKAKSAGPRLQVAGEPVPPVLLSASPRAARHR